MTDPIPRLEVPVLPRLSLDGTATVSRPAAAAKRRRAQRAAAAPERTHHSTGAGSRISGDHPALHYTAIVGTTLVALSSFMISFTSLLAVAGWQHTPDVIHFTTALEIDLPIIVTTVLAIIFKHREQPAPLWMARGFGMVVTAASAGANFMHTVSLGSLDTYEGWIGACFNAFAPISVYLCGELLGHVITRPKPAKRTPATAPAKRATTRKATR